MNEVRKLNVYDVDTILENALVYGVDEYGEILSDEEIGELVEKMEMTLTSKLEYMGKVTINSESFVESIDKEIAKLQDKKKSVINGVNRTKNYLDRFIKYKFTDENGVLDTEGLNKFKLETPSLKISYRKSDKLEVVDVNKVPKEYIKTVVEEKVDAVPLKKFMKDNKITENEYAKIVTNLNLQIK